MDGLRLVALFWTLFSLPMGLMEAFVWVTTRTQAEMTCAQYIESGFKARWVKLSDCETMGRTPIYFTSGGPSLASVKQYVPVYSAAQGSRALLYAFKASPGSGPPMPVEGLRQGGLLDKLFMKKQRVKLRERFGLPEDFVVVNADRAPSASTALGYLISAALCAAFLAYPFLRRS